MQRKKKCYKSVHFTIELRSNDSSITTWSILSKLRAKHWESTQGKFHKNLHCIPLVATRQSATTTGFLLTFFWCSQKSGTLQTALYSKEWSCLFLFVCAKELREAKPLLFLDTSEERAWDFHCWQVRCACLQKSWEVFILSRRERVWIIYLSCIMKHIRVFFKQPVNLKCMRQSWWWR